MINSVSMQIAVVSYKFPSAAVKYIKMFYLKLPQINLNTVLETVVFGVCSCILIKLVYRIFVEDIMVCRLNVYAVVKIDF